MHAATRAIEQVADERAASCVTSALLPIRSVALEKDKSQNLLRTVDMHTRYYRDDKVSQGMGTSRIPLPQYEQLEGTQGTGPGLSLLRWYTSTLGMGRRLLPSVEVWAFGPYHRHGRR